MSPVCNSVHYRPDETLGTSAMLWSSGSQYDPAKAEVNTGAWKSKSRSSAGLKSVVRPEDFIWLELSMVDEVECIAVDREQDGRQFSVITVVNDDDPNIRRKVYQREKAIIDAHPGIYFDFYVRARMGRNLPEFSGKSVGNESSIFKR